MSELLWMGDRLAKLVVLARFYDCRCRRDVSYAEVLALTVAPNHPLNLEGPTWYADDSCRVSGSGLIHPQNDVLKVAADGAQEGVAKGRLHQTCPNRVHGDVVRVSPPVLTRSNHVVVEALLPACLPLPSQENPRNELEVPHGIEHVGVCPESLEHQVQVVRHKAVDRSQALPLFAGPPQAIYVGTDEVVGQEVWPSSTKTHRKRYGVLAGVSVARKPRRPAGKPGHRQRILEGARRGPRHPHVTLGYVVGRGTNHPRATSCVVLKGRSNNGN